MASDATVWRVLDGIDAAALAHVRAARARARELAWAQAAETSRLASSTVGGFGIPGFVLDIDATIVVCHSPGGGVCGQDLERLPELVQFGQVAWLI